MDCGFGLTPLTPLSAVTPTSPLTPCAERGEVISRGMGAQSAPIPLERIHPLPLGPQPLVEGTPHPGGGAGVGVKADAEQGPDTIPAPGVNHDHC